MIGIGAFDRRVFGSRPSATTNKSVMTAYPELRPFAKKVNNDTATSYSF